MARRQPPPFDYKQGPKLKVEWGKVPQSTKDILSAALLEDYRARQERAKAQATQAERS